ncbi:NUDIX domain-containing protein [Streptomyces sp. NPDC057654]|uniref:NUDIX domain-containing protein n=1 Tax=Streptomyces sp. NPDC057654 TaxID=3346196 RepID=UPI0036C01D98
MNPLPVDPADWHAYLAEGNAKQARKRVAADVLIRDSNDSFLLVNPTYKPDWDLPGGMAEANEPPDVAASRELSEELGLTIKLGGLLVVDWVEPHGPWDDQLAFIFDGGVIDTDRATSLYPHDSELSEVAFTSYEESRTRLRPRLTHRFEAAVRALSDGKLRYLHNGISVW